MIFAAFIMTYERPQAVLDMIDCLFRQTLPPQKILVVDNSLSYETKLAVEALNLTKVEYFRVGYNSGPAGAARTGLERLTHDGFKWVYWGDDNDPPRTADAFKRIFAMKTTIGDKKIGALGLMGNNFSIYSVRIKLFKTSSLNGILPVNSLAGGGTMVINTNVLTEALIYPDERLFFGYEELDFCLRIKRAGYEIFIDGDYYREQKESSKKEKKDRFQKIGVNARMNSLWREYYSIRNLMYIVYDKHKSVFGLILICIRVMAKVVFSYSKGFSFGLKYSRLAIQAVRDFVKKNMGLVVQPGSI